MLCHCGCRWDGGPRSSCHPDPRGHYAMTLGSGGRRPRVLPKHEGEIRQQINFRNRLKMLKTWMADLGHHTLRLR